MGACHNQLQGDQAQMSLTVTRAYQAALTTTQIIGTCCDPSHSDQAQMSLNHNELFLSTYRLGYFLSYTTCSAEQMSQQLHAHIPTEHSQLHSLYTYYT